MSDARTLEQASETDTELLSRWKWGGIIIGLIVLQFVMSGVAIFLATGNPVQVIPQYHYKSMHWDELTAQNSKSKELGWKWHVQVQELGTITVTRTVELRLMDKRDQALDSEEVTLVLWHHTRPDDPVTLQLQKVPDDLGHYRAVAKLRKSGLWHIQLKVLIPEKLISPNLKWFQDEADVSWQMR